MEASAEFDKLYRSTNRSVVYREAVRASGNGLPDWLVPFSTIDRALLERVAENLRVGEHDALLDLAPDASFSGVMSIDALMFMDARPAAAEIARVLKPGGLFVMTAAESLIEPFLPTLVRDYRPIFEQAGFRTLLHEGPAGWNKQRTAINESDHPTINGTPMGGDGPQWLAWLVDNIAAAKDSSGQPYWPNTAIIVTWDDWGGFYDHYTGPQGVSAWPYHPPNDPYDLAYPQYSPVDANSWGIRVPFIVISPFVKSAGYVEDSTFSQGAILAFIEQAMAMPPGVLKGDDYANNTQNSNLNTMFVGAPGLAFAQIPYQFTPPTPGKGCPKEQ